MHNDAVENNLLNRTLSCNFSMNGNANTPTVMNTTFVLPSANSTFTIDKGSKRKTGLPRDFANGSTNDFLDRLQMPPPPSQNPMSRSSQFSNSGVPLSLRWECYDHFIKYRFSLHSWHHASQIYVFQSITLISAINYCYFICLTLSLLALWVLEIV